MGLNRKKSIQKRFVLGSASILAFALCLLFSHLCSWAAPFAEYFQFTQPDGVQLTLWGEGDEFHAVFETTSGYTVVFDPTQQAYFYGQRAADGKSLISSGVPAHDGMKKTSSRCSIVSRTDWRDRPRSNCPAAE